MASAAPIKSPASLERARFDRLMGELAASERRVTAAKAQLDAFRKTYSDAHGFSVRLTVEQVARDLEAKARQQGSEA
jgi:hypothetical protein